LPAIAGATLQQYAAYSVNGFLPELILAAGFLLAVVLDAVTRRARSKFFAVWFAIGVLALAGIYSAMEWHAFTPLDPTAWPPGYLIFPYMRTLFLPVVQHGRLVSGYSMAVVDNFSVFFKLLVSLAAILVLLMSLSSKELRSQARRLGEYASLILGMSVGLYLMPASTDLVTMYISLELVSIAGYILAGFSRGTERGAEASLKYFLFGALSSGLMIYGFSLFYGLTGTTNLIAIRQVLALAPATHTGSNAYILWAATIFALAGMAYKISAVPFHFWTPDVYEGAPLPVTALLSVASKAAGFGLLIRFLFIFPESARTSLSLVNWQWTIAILAVLTMTFGNLAALLQTNVRRMLAYSTVAHAGYMLAALAIASAAGVAAIMIYLAAYLFMQLGAFYAVMLLANRIGSEEIDDYRGLGARSPMVASSLIVCLISLTGIPLTAGFVGKFYVLTAILSPNSAGLPWLWLAVAIILNSLLSLYYYLRVAAALFLRRPLREIALERIGNATSSTEPISYPIPALALLAALVVPVIVLGIYFQPLVDFASGVVRFFNFQNIPY
ncbi:MAG: NADH-quinone oxidoreductase subunit N, partial [Acidobacteriaceae bacterium]